MYASKEKINLFKKIHKAKDWKVSKKKNA